MSTTLYRKYRPQTFAEVVAQEHIKVTLENEITSGKLAHAFLFSGPRGIGKTTVARILAKALNCQKRRGFEPCDECSSCVEIREGRSLDLVEIDAASNRGINEIRELREQTKYTPVREKYKVFIIDEVHMLTTEAFNALLKTLEEPPAHAIFILATTEAHKLPETIISRCQRFDFKKVPIGAISEHLAEIAKKEKVKIDQSVIENIARLSEGYLRDSLSLLGQILALGEKEVSEEEASLVIPRSDWQRVMEFVNLLFTGRTKEGLILINELVEEGGDLEHFAKTVIETLRKVLLAKVTGDWQELSWEAGEDWLKKLVQNTKNVLPAPLIKIMEIFLEAQLALKQAAILQLPLEIAVVKASEALQAVNAFGDDGKNNPLPEAKAGSPRLVEAGSVFNAGDKKGAAGGIIKPPVQKSAVSFEKVQEKWQEIIEALKEYNHSLATFMKVGEPLRVEENKIVVGFQFNFHYERIKDTKNLKIVEEVFERIFGAPLGLAGVINQNQEIKEASGKNNAPKRDAMVEAVMETLGGEVVS